MIVTIKLRLKDKHAAELNRQARSVNVVWNYCNEMQEKARKAGRRPLDRYALAKLTAGSSKLLDLHSQTIHQVSIWYDVARRQQSRTRRLRFRNRKALGWVPFRQGAIKIVEPGKVKFRGELYEAMHWRELPDNALVRAGSFNQDAQGRWYINMPIEFTSSSLVENGACVGLDLGLKELATSSDGNSIRMPAFYRSSEIKLATMQRGRKANGTRAIHAKIRNRRRDYLHKSSARLVQEFGLIVVGGVSPSKLSQIHMAKSVHDAGWAGFKHMLSYKAMRHGGRMIEVNEGMTTQLCSDCGVVGGPKGIAQLGIREWSCGDCGATHDRDVNAARNILARGLASLAEGAAKERSSQSSCLLMRPTS